MSDNLKKILILIAAAVGVFIAYTVLIKEKKTEDGIITPIEKDEPKKAEEVAPQETQPAAKADEQEKASDEKKTEETAKDGEYTDATIAAKIEGINKDVKIKDVKNAANMLPPQMRQVPFTTLYPVLVRQAVDFVLLGHEARKEGYDKKPSVIQSISDRKRAIVVGVFLEKEVDQKVSDDVLRKKYEELKKMIPSDEKEFEIAHILLKDEADAKALIKEIKDGKTTFEKSLEKSLDKKTKVENGRIGFIKRMEVTPEFFEKVVETKDGGVVSIPLTLGKAGSSVIQVMSRRALEAPDFEKVRPDIKKAMMPELSQDIVKGIKAKAGLKLFNLEGKEIPERSEEELKKLDQEAPSPIDSSTLSPDFVCAEYNGGKIYLKDVRASYEALPEMLRLLPLEKVYELILLRVVNERILYKEAESAGVQNDKKVLDQIEVDTKLIIQEAFLKEKAEGLISETDLKAEYNATIKNTADKNEMEYRIRHIASATEEGAKEILKKIKNGEKFDDLVAQSTDEATKDRKGEVGYVRKNQLPADVAKVVSKATKGTLVNQVLKFSDDLYSVMRVEDKRAVTPPTFEQMKDKLKNAMLAKKAVQVLESLRSKYKVDYQNIKGLPSSEQIEKVVKAINVKMNEVLETKR